MTSEIVQSGAVEETSESRWSAWQARGAERERTTRRRLFVLAAVVVCAAVLLSGLW